MRRELLIDESYDWGEGVEWHNGIPYVDLGLSCKWACINIGGKTPIDPGQMFMWGETNGYYYYEVGSNHWDWTNYKYGLSGIKVSKYCDNSTYGTRDYKTTLEVADDAAYQIWGSEWRMPTRNQANELYNACNYPEQIEINGVKCAKLVLKSDPSKFLIWNIDYSQTHGGLWTSSLSKNYPFCAAGMAYRYTNQNLDLIGEDENRYSGLSIRPILTI